MPTLTLILDDDAFQGLEDAAKISIKGPPEQLATEILLTWLEEFWGDLAADHSEFGAEPGQIREEGAGLVGSHTLDPKIDSRGILAPDRGKSSEKPEKPKPKSLKVVIPGLASFPAKGWACLVTGIMPADEKRKGIWQYEHDNLERGSTVELPVGSLVLLASAHSGDSKLGLQVRLVRLCSDGGFFTLAETAGPAWAATLRGPIKQALEGQS